MNTLDVASQAAETGQLSRRLAAYVVESRLQDIPSVVQREGLRSIVTWIGCAVAGARHETVEIAVSALAQYAAGGATLIGRSETLDPLNAAMINGISSIVLDFDATQYKKTNIHPSGPVLPPLLALSETMRVSGADLLHAYLLGVEIECRLANEIFGRPDNPGWHVTGVVGPIGAAAGAGRLLGLDVDQMVNAFGIAATQMGGLREMYGTMCKSFTPGRAAQNGMLAAILAKRGFNSAAAPIEGRKALAQVLMGVSAPASLVDRLGEAFEISFNAYKPFACAIVCHAVIDACQRIRREHGVQAKDVAAVRLVVPPVAVELAGNTAPRTGLESKFSVTHAAALALSFDDVEPRHFSDALANDAALRDLRDRVIVEPRAGLRKDQAQAVVETRDGRRLAVTVEHAIGSLENPLSDDGIAQKFKQLTHDVIGGEAAAGLSELCWRLPELDDASAVIRAARTSG